VTATDSDVDPAFSSVSYHISADRLPFTVDDRTGVLTTARHSDRKQRTEPPGPRGRAVSPNSDLRRDPPSESSPGGTPSADLYHFGRDPVPFSVDRKTGVLTTVRPLDREQDSEYRFTLVATDTAGRLDTTPAVPVTVYVDDANDNDPVIISPPARRRSEQSSAVVITVPTTLSPGSLITR